MHVQHINITIDAVVRHLCFVFPVEIRNKFVHFKIVNLKMDNLELKKDEIEAMSAIYGDDWTVENEQTCSYSVTIFSDNDLTKSKFLKLEFKLPEKYPLEEIVIFTVSAPWMSRIDKVNLCKELDSLCVVHKGESVLYLLTDRSKEFINELVNDDTSLENDCDTESETKDSEDKNQTKKFIQIAHGEPLVDRKSTFQAHLAKVESMNDVFHVLDTLKQNKKIESASHNIWAYRIENNPGGIIMHDCDDDGENNAGSRLLKLLEILNVKNVLVVVSRWYGGILLGADRFKHINNVARDLLEQNNYII